jgi:hypothetical protein
MRSESIQNLERNSMAGVLEDYNKTPAELELELSKARGRVARLEALLGQRADGNEQDAVQDSWNKQWAKVEAVPQPDGYSGCGLENADMKPWMRPALITQGIGFFPLPGSEAKKPTEQQLKDMDEAIARQGRIKAWREKLNAAASVVGGHATIFSDLADRITELEQAK